MLTRGDTTLWNSTAVIGTGLPRTCVRNGGTSSGKAWPTVPTPESMGLGSTGTNSDELTDAYHTFIPWSCSLKVIGLAVFTVLAAYANILGLRFIAGLSVEGLVEEIVSEFQLVRCALFRVGLTFGILKPFLAVSRQVRVEAQAYEDLTERGRKGGQLEIMSCKVRVERKHKKPKLPALFLP